jgi:hypothetical protein
MTADWIAVVWSGLVATVLAASVFWVFYSFNATRLDAPVQLGCLFRRDPRDPRTAALGAALLLLLGATVIPAVYTALFPIRGGASWRAGLLLGAVHGVVLLLGFPILGTISACVRSGRIGPPGWFGVRWGRATPVAILAGHLVYGAVLGAVLAAF